MLKRWKLANFKSIENEVDIELAPVTILTGLNSSGKSSILQSIRLITQTLRNQSADRTLVLNGYDIQLGTFQSIVTRRSDHPASDTELLIGFELDLPELPKQSRNWSDVLNEMDARTFPIVSTIKCEARFGAGASQSSQRLDASRVRLLSSSLSVTNVQRSKHDNELPVDFNKGTEQQVVRQLHATVTPLGKKASTDIAESIDPESNLLLFRWGGPNYSLSLREDGSDVAAEGRLFTLVTHFLPKWIIQLYQSAERRRFEVIRALSLLTVFSPDDRFFDVSVERGSIANTLSTATLPPDIVARIRNVTVDVPELIIPDTISVGELLAAFRAEPRKKGFESNYSRAADKVLEILFDYFAPNEPEHASKYGIEFFESSPAAIALTESVENLTQFFVRNVRYLGPLRLEPHGSQSYSPSSESDDVGSKGEFAAIVYESNRYRGVNWWHPIEEKVQFGPLNLAVDTWLKYIGVAQSVAVRDSDVAGVAWRVKIGQEQLPQPLSSVGVGVSQVLPILVAGLLAPPNALLLIEQPELHLHPRAQARLADFFLGLTRSGKRCIVETHSEALVSQFRFLLVRQQPAEECPVSIYFTQLDDRGNTLVSPVAISKDGIIENWPEGFMDETHLVEERITRAAISKRVNRR